MPKPDKGNQTFRTNVPYEPGPEQLLLVAVDGPGMGTEFGLSRPSSILGRGPGASLVLPDNRASRRHLKLTLLPDPVRPTRRVVLVEDLGSTNGVRVNGRPVRRKILRGGEKILVGRTVLRLERRDAIDAAFYDRLQQMATTDPLTGAGNRLSLAQEMERQEAERIRYGRPYSVLMVDLDHFKQVNDQWGHAAGDQALKETAAVVLATLRDSDHVFRYGGEEFAVILAETDRQPAASLAERIRIGIEALTIRYEEHTLRVTVSIGVAEAGPDDVLARADRALYQAKKLGRNRVRVAPTASRGHDQTEKTEKTKRRGTTS